MSLRLAYLVRIGVLVKQGKVPDSAQGGYRLTSLGKALHANVLASWSWDQRWGKSHIQTEPADSP